jgi:hypothetical protein
MDTFLTSWVKGAEAIADETLEPRHSGREDREISAMKTRLMHLGMTVVTLAALIEALGAGVKW